MQVPRHGDDPVLDRLLVDAEVEPGLGGEPEDVVAGADNVGIDEPDEPDELDETDGPPPD